MGCRFLLLGSHHAAPQHLVCRQGKAPVQAGSWEPHLTWGRQHQEHRPRPLCLRPPSPAAPGSLHDKQNH